MRGRHADTIFLALTVILTLSGFFIFSSASFKLLSSAGTLSFIKALANQLLFGAVGGLAALFILKNTNYSVWKKAAVWIFLVSLGITALVFVPNIGVSIGGARRWIEIAGFSFQPSELLKITALLYVAALLTHERGQVQTFTRGFIPLMLVLAVTGGLLLWQPDTDTFVFIALSALAMLIAAGGRWKHLLIAGLIGGLCFLILLETRPYLKERVNSFLHPETSDALGDRYQIEQSLIAIGSGGVGGRGFGQSLQKFGYLPEPTTDSIFAVAAEEFGFIGSLALIVLFLLFAFRGLWLAHKAPDAFGRVFIIGVMTLIVGQSFANIAAMTGLIPLAGTPLLFVSHGGSALMFTLAACGIVLNISSYRRR